MGFGKKIGLVSSALFCLSLFRAVSMAAPNTNVVAQVGDRTITLTEFLSFIEATNPLLLKNSGAPLDSLLQDYVNFALIVEDARKQKLEALPQVQHQYQSILYQTYLQKNVTPRAANLDISDEKIQAFYQENPSIKTRQILLKFPVEVTEPIQAKTKAAAEKIVAEIRSGKMTFDAAAKKYSEDYTKDVGGLMPEGNRFNLIPAYYEASLALKKGAISDPVESIFGFHIIQLIEKIPFSRASESVRSEIATYLKNNVASSMIQETIKDLKKKYSVRVFSEHLKAATK